MACPAFDRSLTMTGRVSLGPQANPAASLSHVRTQPRTDRPQPDEARRSFAIAHVAGGLAGLAGALACAFIGAPHGAEWAALGWLASPLLLAALTLRPVPLAWLETASTLNTVIVLTALAALSGGLSSVFLIWLILVPGEAALTRRPRILLLSIVAGCTAIVALWLLSRAGALPDFALAAPWGASLQALALMGALTYAGILAAEVQRVHRAAAAFAAEREASYRFVTENAADPILRLTAGGFVIYASPASRALFGDRQIEGEQAIDLVDEADRDELQRTLIRAAYFGEEAMIVCRTGEHFVELRARSVVRDDTPAEAGFWRASKAAKPAPREIIAIARDITAHHTLEENLKRLAHSADTQSRSKSRFLANMSHELRTPLNSILGFSQMMGSEIFGPLGHARYREYAGLIQESGNYLLELINDILDIAKIEAGKYTLTRERVDMGEALKRSLRVMHPQYKEKGVNLDITIAKDLPVIDADARAVRQIIFNLLSNALKFTPAGGRTGVSLSVHARALVLEVKDTGIGISGADLKRLARPFEQANDSYVKGQSGTGLGLALVRSLIGLHGGTLTIRSKRGAGTMVSVSLPLTAKAALPRAA